MTSVVLVRCHDESQFHLFVFVRSTCLCKYGFHVVYIQLNIPIVDFMYEKVNVCYDNTHVEILTSRLQIPDNFWCPTDVNLPSGKVTHPLPDGPFEFRFINGAGMRYEAEMVRRCIEEGRCYEASILSIQRIHISIVDPVAEQFSNQKEMVGQAILIFY